MKVPKLNKYDLVCILMLLLVLFSTNIIVKQNKLIKQLNQQKHENIIIQNL